MGCVHNCWSINSFASSKIAENKLLIGLSCRKSLLLYEQLGRTVLNMLPHLLPPTPPKEKSASNEGILWLRSNINPINAHYWLMWRPPPRPTGGIYFYHIKLVEVELPLWQVVIFILSTNAHIKIDHAKSNPPVMMMMMIMMVACSSRFQLIPSTPIGWTCYPAEIDTLENVRAGNRSAPVRWVMNWGGVFVLGGKESVFFWR